MESAMREGARILSADVESSVWQVQWQVPSEDSGLRRFPADGAVVSDRGAVPGAARAGCAVQHLDDESGERAGLRPTLPDVLRRNDRRPRQSG